MNTNKKIFIIILTIIVIIVGGILFYSFNFKNIITTINNNGQQKVEREKIGVGVIATTQETIDQYQAIVEYLNSYSDDTWYLVPLKDYGTFITEMQIGQIKAGFTGSAVGYKMIKENLALPVVRGEKNGISTYFGYLFTRKDSGLKTIKDLENKKFAFVDAYTSAGYFFPKYLLKINGYDVDNFFRVSSFLGSHDKAIMAVFDKTYDAGAAKDSSWDKLVKENPKISEEMQILAKGGPFPEQTFMINSEFGDEEVNELRKILLGMTDSEDGVAHLKRFGADKFIATNNEDFGNIKNIFDYLGEN